jgi:hypothetical protein
VVEQVLRNEIDLGITFNPPENPSVRVERTRFTGWASSRRPIIRWPRSSR